MTKYVYTLSSANHLPLYALHSIKSLIRYVPAEDVIVFVTPPADASDLSMLRQTGVDVRAVDSIAKPFAAFREKPKGYGEKLHLCTVDADTVVFLDCDTLVYGDPAILTEGKFDFKARPGSFKWDADTWRSVFKSRNLPVFKWMPNCGVLVFKDGLHQRIQDDWSTYLTGDLKHGPGVDHKEQFALALALAGRDLSVAEMTPREHVMEWSDERPTDGIVYHIGRTLDERPNGVIETLQHLTRELQYKFDWLPRYDR